MKITDLFERGEFAVSAEVGPPKGIHIEEMIEDAKKYLGGVDAINVTDCQSSVMRVGSLAVCKELKDAGMNDGLPVFRHESRFSGCLQGAEGCRHESYFPAGLP